MIAILEYLIRSKSGATAVEYGLIVMLICAALIGGVTATGNGIETLFGGVSNAFKAAAKTE